MKINGDFIQLLWNDNRLSIFKVDITHLQNQFVKVCKGIEQGHPDFSEIKQLSNIALNDITAKWRAANVFLYYGLMHRIDKNLFLEEYRAVLTDLNGRQLITEFSPYAKIEIVDQWHHIKVKTKSKNLIFTIKINNNEVSVVQTEQLKDQLKKHGFISLTVRLNIQFKTMLIFGYWKFVMLKLLKDFFNSRRKIKSNSS